MTERAWFYEILDDVNALDIYAVSRCLYFKKSIVREMGAEY